MHICVFTVCQSVSLCCIVRSQTQTTCRFFANFEIKLYHVSDFLEMFLRYQLSAAANLTQVMVFGSIFWVWLKCIYLRPVSYFNFRMVGQNVGQHFQERSADVTWVTWVTSQRPLLAFGPSTRLPVGPCGPGTSLSRHAMELPSVAAFALSCGPRSAWNNRDTVSYINLVRLCLALHIS
jgi:hypothetical protein